MLGLSDYGPTIGCVDCEKAHPNADCPALLMSIFVEYRKRMSQYRRLYSKLAEPGRMHLPVKQVPEKSPVVQIHHLLPLKKEHIGKA